MGLLSDNGSPVLHGGTMSESRISRAMRDRAAVVRISSILSHEQFDSRLVAWGMQK